MSFRTWVFTLNNYTVSEVESIENWKNEVKKLVVAKEIGNKGTPHLQGAVTFNSNHRMGFLKKLLSRAHWQSAKSKDCFLYCKKADSNVFININNSKQGSRTDLQDIVKAIEEGASNKALWNKWPGQMVRYHKGIYEGMKYWKKSNFQSRFKLKDFPWNPCSDPVTILWGKPGIGKTCFAKAHFNNPLFVSHMDDLGNLTEDHDGIIFDDCDFCHIPRTAQIHLVDWENTRSIHIRYKTAIIPKGMKRIFTTNNYEGRIFDLNDGAISRRVTVSEVRER